MMTRENDEEQGEVEETAAPGTTHIEEVARTDPDLDAVPVPAPTHQQRQQLPSVRRIEDLDPPRTKREIGRDYVLTLLDGRFFQVLGMIVLFLIVADGAFFFFLLMGWHAMCTPRLDCEPRNWWYNWSVQVLTALFTYTATVSLPWRVANFWHTAGLGYFRSNTPGLDLYGLPTMDIWFHIPLCRRLGIIIVLILNVLTQYVNQVMRIIFHTYELQSEHGVEVTVFFVASFFFAFLGFLWMMWESARLRKANPGFFDDGGSNIDIVKASWKKYCCQTCGGKAPKEEEEEEEIEPTEEELPYEHEDPTTNPVAVFFGNRRAELRMLGIG